MAQNILLMAFLLVALLGSFVMPESGEDSLL